jgi:trans-aconitate 2-methyltransferase
VWDPEQYLKFSEPRLRPAVDLLSRIALDAPRSVYDLGCGAGNVTRLLAARWPEATITGVDDSDAMLEEAARIPSRIVWRKRQPIPIDAAYADSSPDLDQPARRYL